MKQIKDFLRQDLLALAVFAMGLLAVAAIGVYIYGVIEASQRLAVVSAFVLVMAFSLAALYSVYRYISNNQTEVYAEELAAENHRKAVNL
jgi:membrane protein implicated in regulation of membrane protease activity